MAKINGTTALFYINGTLLGVSTDLSFNKSMETRDITDKSSAGHRQVAEGLRDTTCSGSMWVDPSQTMAFDDVADFIDARTEVSVNVGKTATSGEPYWNGTGFFTSLDLTFPLEETANGSFDFQFNGAATKLTVT